LFTKCLFVAVILSGTLYSIKLHSPSFGDRGSTVFMVLGYKSEGRWFDPVSVEFSLIYNPSDRTMALGSTQPLTEMSTGSISWEVKSGRSVKLTTLPPSWAIVT